MLSLLDKYRYLSGANFPFRVLKPEETSQGIKFHYLNAKSLDALLYEAIQSRSKTRVLQVFLDYREILDRIPTETTTLGNGEFEEYFGKEKNGGSFECLRIGCLDLTLENIFQDGKDYCLMDYEWTFEFPIPKNYVIYRSLLLAYSKYFPNRLNEILPFEEVAKEFGINSGEKELYLNFEWVFQNRTHKNVLPFNEYVSAHEPFLQSRYNFPTLADKHDQVAARLEKEIAEKLQLMEKNNALQKEVQEAAGEIDRIHASVSWRITGPVRRARVIAHRFFMLGRKFRTASLLLLVSSQKFRKRCRESGLLESIRHSVNFVGKNMASPGEAMSAILAEERNLELYQQWIATNESLDPEKIQAEIENFAYKPKISVIVPVYNVKLKLLNECIRSVTSQYYDNWELCIYDDASTESNTKKCLRKWSSYGDERIKVRFGRSNMHISGASNEALKMATGEFVALLDNDDVLAKHALFESVKLLNEREEADFIYSDEDKLDLKGRRCNPFFKPDWSIDLFLSAMYTCHLGIFRKAVIDRIGGFRKGYEGSQDYDLVLRVIKEVDERNILHIPKILYHWRMLETSTALNSPAKMYAYEAAVAALNDYLRRNGIAGEAVHDSSLGFYRIKYRIKGNPLVSIIIPFKDKPGILKKCLESILQKTGYGNYEILLVNNQSRKRETLEYLEEIKNNGKTRILAYDHEFNFSSINNHAARKANGDYLIFLNNDTEVIDGNWLENMLQHAQRKEVGAVGALLLYPDDTIQHAGIVVGLGGTAGHVHHGISVEDPEYAGVMRVARNYSAVTGACLMVKKDLFFRVNGFDEKDFSIAFNDVDLCLKLRELGYLIVYTPYAKLYHHESVSRGYDMEMAESNPERYEKFTEEQNRLREKWAHVIMHDPYYNPNLPR
ncbi:MAG: glycosyltransferase family 2 protein [Thermoleophilia bacterium]|nr:glycosyltransferase family 2 protein [Thermoleophilia bacterium]